MTTCNKPGKDLQTCGPLATVTGAYLCYICQSPSVCVCSVYVECGIKCPSTKEKNPHCLFYQACCWLRSIIFPYRNPDEAHNDTISQQHLEPLEHNNRSGDKAGCVLNSVTACMPWHAQRHVHASDTLSYTTLSSQRLPAFFPVLRCCKTRLIRYHRWDRRTFQLWVILDSSELWDFPSSRLPPPDLLNQIQLEEEEGSVWE